MHFVLYNALLTCWTGRARHASGHPGADIAVRNGRAWLVRAADQPVRCRRLRDPRGRLPARSCAGAADADRAKPVHARPVPRAVRRIDATVAALGPWRRRWPPLGRGQHQNTGPQAGPQQHLFASRGTRAGGSALSRGPRAPGWRTASLRCCAAGLLGSCFTGKPKGVREKPVKQAQRPGAWWLISRSKGATTSAHCCVEDLDL